MDYGKIKKLLADGKVRGEKWVRKALPILVEISNTEKEIEEKKKKAEEPVKTNLALISGEYKPDLKLLGDFNTKVRERVLKEYEGDNSVREDGVGEIVFPKTWTFEITDMTKVDRHYLTTNDSLIREEIKKGVRKMKGIKIFQKRGIQVRTGTQEREEWGKGV